MNADIAALTLRTITGSEQVQQKRFIRGGIFRS
jgi:hypothetical protein